MNKQTAHHKLALLGGNIRRMRKQNGVRLSELAEAAGITEAYLSQIERDLVEPSLPVLRRIARSLKTEISMFFVDEVQTDVLITKPSEEKIIDLVGARYRFMMPLRLSAQMRSEMSVMIVYMAPLSAEETEFITHAGAEFTTILSGEMVYEVDGEIHSLGEGDSIYVDRNVEHKVYNLTQQLASCLAAIEIVDS